MVIEQRADILNSLRINKLRLSLEVDELRELESYLKSEWNICLRSSLEVDRLIKERCSKSKSKMFRELLEQQAFLIEEGTGISPAIEQHWYDFLAQDPINGIVHSQKRTFIFDGVAWATALCRLVSLRGTGLDVGCHTGYQTIWLARQTQLSMTGIDASNKAIAYASRKAANDANVKFQKIEYPSNELNGSFSFIYCSDALPESPAETQALLRWCSNRLAKHGVLVLFGDLMNWADPDFSDELHGYAAESSLGYGIADVIGGWNGDSFEAKGTLALIKGAAERFPKDLERQFIEVWQEYGFKDYANDKTTPANEKTVGYFRAKQNQGRARTTH